MIKQQIIFIDWYHSECPTCVFNSHNPKIGAIVIILPVLHLKHEVK